MAWYSDLQTGTRMTDAPTPARWTYRSFEPDMAAEELPRFEELIRLWQSRRNGRRVPAWRDFDFLDFKGWHGLISVYEITYDPFDWKVRLSGTCVDHVFGQARTGKTRSELYADALEEEEATAFYEKACADQMICLTRGPINLQDRDFHWVEFLELPCSDGPEVATHTIEAMIAL
ncbi:MAG: hypothetical protein RIM33_14745 [Alphaproteobacteria bacterium]